MIDLIEKRMRTNLKFILSFFIVCVLTSCTGNTMYYSYSPTPSDGWEKDDTIYFHIPIKDSLSLIQINTEIRSSDAYPYKELWLIVSHNFKNKEYWEIDTLQFILADDEGKRNEQSWSCFYPKSKALNPIFVKDTGNYVMKINHYMHDEHLIGIHNIGININK